MDILSSNYKNNIKVKNGFATLCDKVFIKENFDFKSNFIIDVIKGSTGKAYKAIFPYKINKEMVERVEEKYLDTAVLNYLKQHKEHLLNRSIEKNSKWFEYGRSQGILDIYKNKLSINNLTKDGSLKIVEATGKGVFSGLYILYENEEEKLNIVEKLNSKEFFKYIKTLKKYKSGGYYTFSSKELEQFLNWSLK